MKKIILFIAGMLCAVLSLRAQSPREIKPLSIGDTVPDIVFHHMLNYKDSAARLSDFRGKLVILDFWSSWCGACIDLFPHMNDLQKKFGESIRIFLVNQQSKHYGDDRDKITKIIAGVSERSGKKIMLPVLYDCPALDNYFPHQSIPHEVLIDAKGKVVAITYSYEITDDNIKDVLAGRKIHLPLKQDIMSFNMEKPLFTSDNGGPVDDFLYRSIITGWQINGTSWFGVRRNKDHQIVGFFMCNKPLFILVGTAYTGEEYNSPYNISIADLHDSLRLNPPDNETRYKYLYCYDLTIPPTSSYEKLQEYMREDVKRCFNISVRKEVRKIDCFVVSEGPSINKSFTRGGRQSCDLDKISVKKYFRNYPIRDIIRSLNTSLSVPLINECHISQNIDIELPYDLKDEKAVINTLNKAGFILKAEKREVEVTLITDK